MVATLTPLRASSSRSQSMKSKPQRRASSRPTVDLPAPIMPIRKIAGRTATTEATARLSVPRSQPIGARALPGDAYLGSVQVIATPYGLVWNPGVASLFLMSLLATSSP